MPKVSVIVPVYNVEKYLDRCLRSLAAQTLEDIEFLFVDDGSTDESAAMLDRFAAEHLNARVIHKQNGGVSSARNAGLDLATGDYIGFVDSDDFVEEHAFQRAVQAAEGSGADIVCFGYASVWGDEAVLKVVDCREQLFDGGPEAFSAQFRRDYRRFVWDKLYRRSLFDGVRFPVERTIYEDMFILPLLFVKARRVLRIPDTLYYYRARPMSLTRMRSDKLSEWLEAAKLIIDVTRENYPEFIDDAQGYYNIIELRLFDAMLADGHFRAHPCWKSQRKLLRKRLFSILRLKSPLVRRGRKAYAVAVVLAPDAVSMYVRWKHRKDRRLLTNGGQG